VTGPSAAETRDRLQGLGPGILAASSFAITDVLSRLVFLAGADVLTLSTIRGLAGLVFMIAWLRVTPSPVPHTPRARWIALGMGVLFAGLVFGIFKAIEIVEVPIAILTYFVYPLFTGIFAALLRLERLSWRGATAALVAFLGLTLTVGAHPGKLALAGLAFAVGAACCRTAVLLITRAALRDSDPRLTTWYTLVSSTAIFVAASLLTWTWNAPQTTIGWLALIGVTITTTVATLALFISTNRIGPFRSALIMNLEPLLATILSALFLGEVITPIQALGGAIMLAALVAFQLRR
jgi:drug/metabolite transporter (DMT)-like permease